MVRATLNCLNLENKCEKNSFWAECARHMTMMDGGIVRDDKRCPDEVFHDGSKPKFWGDLHTFGEVAIVKFGQKIKSKLENRGQVMVFLGFEAHHPKRTYRFLNWSTKRIVHSRDVLWLNVIVGDYKKLNQGGLEKVLEKLNSIEI